MPLFNLTFRNINDGRPYEDMYDAEYDRPAVKQFLQFLGRSAFDIMKVIFATCAAFVKNVLSVMTLIEAVGLAITNILPLVVVAGLSALHIKGRSFASATLQKAYSIAKNNIQLSSIMSASMMMWGIAKALVGKTTPVLDAAPRKEGSIFVLAASAIVDAAITIYSNFLNKGMHKAAKTISKWFGSTSDSEQDDLIEIPRDSKKINTRDQAWQLAGSTTAIVAAAAIGGSNALNDVVKPALIAGTGAVLGHIALEQYKARYENPRSGRGAATSAVSATHSKNTFKPTTPSIT